MPETKTNKPKKEQEEIVQEVNTTQELDYKQIAEQLASRVVQLQNDVKPYNFKDDTHVINFDLGPSLTIKFSEDTGVSQYNIIYINKNNDTQTIKRNIANAIFNHILRCIFNYDNSLDFCQAREIFANSYEFVYNKVKEIVGE